MHFFNYNTVFPQTALYYRTHNVQGTDRHHIVTSVAIRPGVPSWIVALLQDKLFPTKCLTFKAEPSTTRGERQLLYVLGLCK